jgi:outer membrane protein assembly factor BamB
MSRTLSLAVLGGISLAAALLAGPICALQADDWPQWLGENREGVWRETGLLEKFPAAGPKILWRTPLGIGYSGPAVAADRVYVMDFERATDEKGEPRRATRQGIPGRERLVCLSATDGKPIWTHDYDCPYTISYPSGPRTTPLVHQGRVYALGAMGDLLCLDAADGKPRWSKNLVSEYKHEAPVWGYAAHPLIDGDLLYCLVGGQGSAVVAFHKDTGEQVWKALSTEEIGYSPPVIFDVAGKRQLVIWLSEAIYGLDPATGAVFWKQEYPIKVPPQRPAVNIITVKKVADSLFISTFYHGPMMLKVDAAGASVAWKGKSNSPVLPDGAHCLMATPVFKDGYGYAVGCLGELRCFDVETGKQLWQTYEPVAGKKADCGTVFIVPQGDRYVMFNDQGDLILADLSPEGYREIDRAHILDPVSFARGRDIVWSHPAFARRAVFARNDKEIVCVSLAAESQNDG